MTSKLVKSQTKLFGPKEFTEDGRRYCIVATVRHDNCCGNGHNSFAITAKIDEARGGYWRDHMGGCCHEEIAKHFPELAPYIKWHLTDTTGPMHYIANTMYWLGWRGWIKKPDLEHARSTAVWPELPEAFLAPLLPPPMGKSKSLFNALSEPMEKALADRLPALLAEFQKDVEALGLEY